ncbi:MAG: hypothetical protein J0L84_19480, partial [Verrucomicrobia bacterium]|nr:hypothetical protein [Verrucomicrobiota bacterium]
PVPRLSGPAWTDGTFRVQVPTVPGGRYALEFRPAVGSGGWSAVSGPVAGDGAVATLSHTAALGDRGFYRVSVEQDPASSAGKSGAGADRTE